MPGNFLLFHVAVGLAALLGLSHPIPSCADNQSPKVQIATPFYDLGVVAQGQVVTHEFVIQNTGKATLRLEQIHPSRGVKISSYHKMIAPGGTGRLRVEIDTWALLGPWPLSVAVSTNDPAAAQIDLQLKIDVHPFVIAHPGYARYLYVQHAREGTIVQTVWADDGVDFHVLRVESPYPFLTVSFREAKDTERRPEGRGRQWRVELTIKPDAIVGPLAGFLVIHVDHAKQKKILVPVTGFVRPMFAITPPTATLGDVDPSQRREARFFVQNFAEESIDLLAATSDVPGIQAEVKPIEAGRSYQLWIKVGGEIATGPFSGEIRVRTSSVKQPVLSLPLSGRIVSSTVAPVLPQLSTEESSAESHK